MNYGELTAEIGRYTENTNSKFVQSIPTFIRNAEKRIYIDVPDLPRSRLTAFTECIPGQAVYATPLKYLAPISMELGLGCGKFLDFLDNKEPEYVKAAFAHASSGRPRAYGLQDDDEFLIGPTPSQEYRLTFNFMGYPESIIEANNTWLGDNFEFVLLYGSLVEAYTFMKGEPDVMQAYVTQYNDSLALLRKFTMDMSHRDSNRYPPAR